MRSLTNQFYTSLSWPYGWFVRGWSGSPAGDIKRIMRLNITRMAEHQDVDSIISFIKTKNQGEYTIKAEMNNVNIKIGDPRPYRYKSCKVLIQGDEIPSFDDIQTAFVPYGSIVRHWRSKMIFNDEIVPKLISCVSPSNKRPRTGTNEEVEEVEEHGEEKNMISE